ncbi:MAG: ABC transporter ATP-binding protein [Fibrobacterota bacterium]
MTKDANILLDVNDLKLHYLTRFGDRVDAVKGVSFQLERGKVLGLAGESGCGKSTLVKGILGLFIPPLYKTSGEVYISGTETTEMDREDLRVKVLGKKISMIPQGALNSLNPTRRVRKFAADVMAEHEPGLTRGEINQRLSERFEAIGLDPQVLDKYPVELSGGMKQRVVIGISTLMNPDVVIADEPTSALDVSTQKSVIIMLKELMKKGYFGSMIFITHELPLLYHVANDIAVMYQGEIVEQGTSEQIIHEPTHEYSKMLMAEAKKLDAHGERYGK